jgi:8-oxo-dGTP pyrophosphatase MutT (NUDIX family)
VIHEASSVILLRQAPVGIGIEVFLLRRRKGASFMASAYVFPGGGADAGEDARTTAVRELFEEAGILLAHDVGQDETLEMVSLATLRRRVLAGANAAANLAAAGLAWSTDVLAPWSHWITPSVEARRFSARFFVAELPPGQVPQFDDIETVDQVWVSPTEALARAAELRLPPPQVRTFWELATFQTIAEVRAAAKVREAEPHPIMPRLSSGPPALLLPWDPEYGTHGTGEGTPLTYQPSWAVGPSRFVMEDGAWKHVAPGSTPPG